MPIEEVDINAASEGNFGVLAALTATRAKLGNLSVALFLDLVPERGEKLWLLFKSFRDQGNGGFDDFVKETIKQAEPTRLFYPKECILDPMTQGWLLSDVANAIKSTNPQTNDGMLSVYFAEGPAYNAARKISCHGCPERSCRHWLKV